MSTIHFGGFGDTNEFEDEPEDELASRGMHIATDDEEEEKEKLLVDDEEDVIVGVEDELEIPPLEAEEEEVVDPEFKNGLEELEEMEKTYVESTALAFGGADEEEM